MSRINPYKMWNGSFIPEWILSRKEISQGAKLCYSRMARYAGKNGECKPKISTLAKALGISKRQASSYLKELKEFQLIESERPGLGKSNHYYFIAHKWMDLPKNMVSDNSDTSCQDVQDTSCQDVQDTSCQDVQDTSSPYNKDLRESSEESHIKENINTSREESTDSNKNTTNQKLSQKHSSSMPGKSPNRQRQEEAERINGCPVPESLQQVPGFTQKFEDYLQYMEQEYHRRLSSTATELKMEKLRWLKEKGDYPIAVINQTMDALNKMFYPLLDFDSGGDEQQIAKSNDYTGRAAASSYKEYNEE